MSPKTVTQVAQDNAMSGDVAALFVSIYDKLRALAAAYLRNEKPGHTLRPTELVHELYLRLTQKQGFRCDDATQYFRIAARAMRQLLVEHARGRCTEKRGGKWKRVTLGDPATGTAEFGLEDLLTLDAALDRLARDEPRLAAVVELRFFAGLSVRETAQALGLPRSTINDQWHYARAWLHREIFGRRPE